MSTDLETIKRKIAENKEYLLKTYGVEEIGVFGSFARGDQNAESDIDVAIEINHDKVAVGLFEFSRMRFYLEDLLGRKVDLVTKNGIKPLIKDRILSQLVII
ncbi:MAG: polymerase beta domain protein region protein [Parcubacteria group bacterium GW2011_GWA2_49_9]|nr:MAG: polymerase beta domain protein region protein [Parcubacteria group bacterium GW2011_GWA2_49_9]